jgi:hypothetical protein
MADNPFYKNKEAEFKIYALAFLRKLKYLDYELIVEEDRANAMDKHREEYQDLESQKSQDATQSEELEKQMDPLLKSAKIDCTVGMIAKIVREHKESRTLSYFPKYNEIFQPHDVQIDEFT